MAKLTKKQVVIFNRMMQLNHKMIMAYHTEGRDEFEAVIDEIRDAIGEKKDVKK